jgi:ABC-type dipeptide/oligopeptide/nickel transport system permease subunit
MVKSANRLTKFLGAAVAALLFFLGGYLTGYVHGYVKGMVQRIGGKQVEVMQLLPPPSGNEKTQSDRVLK